MTAAHDVPDTCRPRIRRDVLFTETSDGVLFHNAQGGFQLSGRSAYRFAALVVPFLNGEATVGELCAALPAAQQPMITSLVGKLLERGFARDATGPARTDVLPAEVAERFAAQIEYVDHFTDGAAERFARFRATRVAVLGEDLIARHAALGLVRNGLARVDVESGVDGSDGELATAADALGAEVAALPSAPPTADGRWTWAALDGFDVVLCAGADAPRQAFALRAAGIPAGARLLAAVTVGGLAVAGPTSSAESAGCVVCMMLRHTDADETGAAAGLWSRTVLPPGVLDGPAVGGNLAAMLGNLLAYEVFRSRTGALPAETEGRAVVQDLDSMDILSERVLPHPRCPYCVAEPAPPVDPAVLAVEPAEPATEADDTDTLLTELNERSVLVGRHFGVFSRFDDDEVTQLPLRTSALVLGTGGERRTVTAFDVHHTAGARMRALRTALGVYAGRVPPLPSAAAGRPVSPERLVTATGLGGADPESDLVGGMSLVHGDPVLLPAGALAPFGPANRVGRYQPTSAGIGVGGSPAEALRAGLHSALCHDALLRAVGGQRPVRRVEPAGLDGDPELRFLLRTATTLGVQAELLDLGEHVLLARIGGEAWSVAADASWSRAATAALRDLLGQVQLGPDQLDLGDPLLPAFEPNTLVVRDTVAADLTGRRTAAESLAGLRAAGRDALAVQLTSADLRVAGFTAVRVALTA
jgi:bacteriocin biosynthesis cyclodehydratase domain-containing protein